MPRKAEVLRDGTPTNIELHKQADRLAQRGCREGECPSRGQGAALLAGSGAAPLSFRTLFSPNSASKPTGLRNVGVERANALREGKEQRSLRGQGRRPFLSELFSLRTLQASRQACATWVSRGRMPFARSRSSAPCEVRGGAPFSPNSFLSELCKQADRLALLSPLAIVRSGCSAFRRLIIRKGLFSGEWNFALSQANRLAYAICLALSKTIINRFRVAHP